MTGCGGGDGEFVSNDHLSMFVYPKYPTILFFRTGSYTMMGFQLSQWRVSPYSMSHPMWYTHTYVQSRLGKPRGKIHSYTL